VLVKEALLATLGISLTLMGDSWEETPLNITALVESFSVLTPTKWEGGSVATILAIVAPSNVVGPFQAVG
tara:strand:+ start:5198 stop:5407 length:210 start_codon:yes stop_codon:yes gene_type:complete